jgi:hypothetical protein
MDDVKPAGARPAPGDPVQRRAQDAGRAAEPPEELGFTADHVVGTITDLPARLRG